MSENEIETHVVAALALAGAGLALVHPGFTIPNGTAETISGILTVGAVVLEWAHKFFKATKQQKEAMIKGAVASLANALESGKAQAAANAAKTTLAAAATEAKQAESEFVIAKVPETGAPTIVYPGKVAQVDTPSGAENTPNLPPDSPSV